MVKRGIDWPTNSSTTISFASTLSKNLDILSIAKTEYINVITTNKISNLISILKLKRNKKNKQVINEAIVPGAYLEYPILKIDSI